MTVTCDLLVLGGGMAGLAAAARAATNGARVILLEKAPHLGGTAQLSSGHLWLAASYEVLRAVNPGGKAELAAALVEDFPAAVDWVRSLGVDCMPPEQMRVGQGHQIDIHNYVRACERTVRVAGGSVRMNVATDELVLESGRVVGAIVRESGGSVERIGARWTLLATGSYPANPEFLAKYVHPKLASAPLRANPYSTGDGLRLGLAAGASYGKVGAGFYGHLVPFPVKLDDPTLFGPLSQHHSDRCILVNMMGQRFTDESLGDHMNAQAVLLQPEGRALLIADEAVVVQPSRLLPVGEAGALTVAGKFSVARRHGAHCATANGVEEFADLPDEWGYDGPAVVETLRLFNDLAGGAVEKLSPRRVNGFRPLDRPPYHMIEVQPAVTFPHVGLLIDRFARVLSPAGRPVPGLLAAGVDAGGIYVKQYAGSLSAALVFGLRAARTATGSGGRDRTKRARPMSSSPAALTS